MARSRKTEAEVMTEAAEPKPKRAKPEPPESAKTIKRTIVLKADTNFKLKVLAAKKGMDDSALVEEMIAPQLRGVVVSFRGVLPYPASTVEDGEEDAAA